jgi:Flp pilus assembly pilin Flp
MPSRYAPSNGKDEQIFGTEQQALIGGLTYIWFGLVGRPANRVAATSAATSISFEREISHMLKYYIKTKEALERLRKDNEGVVSLEYVIVGACVCAIVVVMFQGTGTNTLSGALNTGFSAIGTAMGKLTTP